MPINMFCSLKATNQIHLTYFNQGLNILFQLENSRTHSQPKSSISLQKFNCNWFVDRFEKYYLFQRVIKQPSLKKGSFETLDGKFSVNLTQSESTIQSRSIYTSAAFCYTIIYYWLKDYLTQNRVEITIDLHKL